MEEVVFTDGQRDKTIYTYKLRAWRWLNVKQDSNKSLAKVMDIKEAFCFKASAVLGAE